VRPALLDAVWNQVIPFIVTDESACYQASPSRNLCGRRFIELFYTRRRKKIPG
jgi:hypothetical protein